MDMKQSLIEEIQKRKDLGIIEENNAILLEKLIRNAETNNEAMMIAELGTMYKKTGLFFDVRLEKIGSEIKYLKKSEELSFDNGGLHHKLIIGDNYDALQNLLITHKGKIDVIYIDPPYGCNDMGEFADTNYTNNLSRDNLLSMLYPRLTLARNLLSNEGVIFCSIDDKNQAYIKCLFDEIFGEHNFISCICRECIKGGTVTKNIKKVHDYVLVYAKELKINGKDKTLLVGDEFSDNVVFKYKDDKGKYAKGRELNKWGASSRREDSPSMYYPIPGPNGIEVYPIRNDGSEGRWRWGKKKLLNAVKNDDVLFEMRDNGTYVAYEKIREQKIKNKQLISFLKNDYINANGSDELKSIFNTLMSDFDYAKPVNLIQELIKYYPTDDFIVLDFFAGSGTTGQAVLEQNRKDGGSRKFILCTNNEVGDRTPNGIAYDITSRRLKRVMSGLDYDGIDDFEWLKNNNLYGDSLDVYEIKEVNNRERTDGKSPFEVIDEANYDLPKFNNIREKNEWICQNFENTQKYIEGEQ